MTIIIALTETIHHEFPNFKFCTNSSFCFIFLQDANYEIHCLMTTFYRSLTTVLYDSMDKLRNIFKNFITTLVNLWLWDIQISLIIFNKMKSKLTCC